MTNAAPVNNDPRFLFLTFECPHCECLNVLNKKYSRTEVVCTNLACRRVITLDLADSTKNFNQFNKQDSDKNKAA